MTNGSKASAVRLVLGIEYDGSHFHGWQRQKHDLSVQSELESVLSQVANHPVELTCAGRTDTGVHALGQVVHFDSYSHRPDSAWLRGANSLLSSSISIRYAVQVDSDFHARFSALSRSYLYIIDNNTMSPAVLSHGMSWHQYPLDVELMNQACGYFLGEKDFSSLRSSQCQSHTPHRCITELTCHRSGNYIAIKVTANAFLHHMVRNIVGILLEVGEAIKSPEWAETVISAKDRRLAGVTAKPNGLYLQSVEYPANYNLPSISKQSFLFEQFLSNS